MKITYEFDIDIDKELFYHFELFKNAPYMVFSLNQLRIYMHELRKGFVDDEKEEIIDKVLDFIHQSEIGEL